MRVNSRIGGRPMIEIRAGSWPLGLASGYRRPRVTMG
jgi:hypothetical protein